jgi:hypothetical protein
MPTYCYTGDMPTVFINMRKDGKTWTPRKGDTIKWPATVNHPLLELVVPAQKSVEKEPVTVSVEPDDTQSPETADESKES